MNHESVRRFIRRAETWSVGDGWVAGRVGISHSLAWHWVRNCALRAAQARECDDQAAPCSHHASIARRSELVETPAVGQATQ